VQVEFTRISWPTRNELRDSTAVVIVTVMLVSLFLFVVDRRCSRFSVSCSGRRRARPVRAKDEERHVEEWYVVHTYSGHENKVKANLERRSMRPPSTTISAKSSWPRGFRRDEGREAKDLEAQDLPLLRDDRDGAEQRDAARLGNRLGFGAVICLRMRALVLSAIAFWLRPMTGHARTSAETCRVSLFSSISIIT